MNTAEIVKSVTEILATKLFEFFSTQEQKEEASYDVLPIFLSSSSDKTLIFYVGLKKIKNPEAYFLKFKESILPLNEKYNILLIPSDWSSVEVMP